MSVYGEISRPPVATNRPKASAFELENVSYHYAGDIVALKDVSFKIEAGEKVALIGANGCGKSTLIKILDGLIFPQQGSLLAFGEPITEAGLRNEQNAFRFRRRIGFVFQNSDAQLFNPTVREEIAFGPLQMGLQPDVVEQRLQDVVQLLDIGKLLDRAPFRLSGGEKKKVALASTLVVNPDVILLDEPTGGLDPRSQQWLVELLVNLNRAGKTLVTTTHDLGIIRDISHRVLVFSEQHTLVAERPSDALFDDLDLLLHVNLIHEHMHRHGNLVHAHPHYHSGEHDHTHF